MKADPADNSAALASELAENTGLLSAEDWQEILAPLPPQPDLLLSQAWVDMISVGLIRYWMQRDPKRPSLKVHRMQFERLHRAAFDMRAALLEIWCSPGELYVRPEERYADDFDTKYPIPLNTLMLSRLDHMIELSRQALNDDSFLAHIRGQEVDDSVQQSTEARALWKTLFGFWYWASGHLGYSYQGPLHRFIERIQLGAGGPPVNPDTLKRAVQRWRRKKGILNRGTDGSNKTPSCPLPGA